MVVKTPTKSPWHLDIISLIVEHVHDRRDLYNCALVNRPFHCAVTPRLYRVLDTQRTHGINGSRVVHPASTLLQRPAYANYVRHISETATAGDVALTLLPSATAAFRLCTNLSSFSWTGGGFLSDDDFDLLTYLDTILTNNVPLRDLVIRASPGLSLPVWNRLKKLTNLKSLGLWCLEAEHELVISPLSDLYMQYLSYLPNLRSLCLKAAIRCSVPDILTLLPTLTSLEVEYYGFSPIARRSPSFSQTSTSFPSTPPPSLPNTPITPTTTFTTSILPYSLPSPSIPQQTASLHTLTVTTSALSISSPHNHTEMWAWISQLIPNPHTLHSFTLRAFSPNAVEMPWEFWSGLARVHGRSVRVLEVEGVILPLGFGVGMRMGMGCQREDCDPEDENECMFPKLEKLACALPTNANLSTIATLLTLAPALRELKLTHPSLTLNLDIAKRWMTRDGSQLRVVELGEARYMGEWKFCENTWERSFEVKCGSNKSCITWI
ncbi:hypothetical protein BDY19DRAFT_300212 [Irpex rosettiformis]|uniref:Uncharacterized protein n=1 Tax=Irpex rosettiformis TaxID=378272 RepID=A0ACB8TYM7_9APHY|nr:hypothetical protein BDY19DRAFT_300212 [Irpex rosettiformis]